MSDTLKVGIIGIGILGSQHARNFSKHEKSQVVSVADPIEIRAEDMAKEVGARAYADFQEMLSKEQLDLVVVATPDPLHKEPFLASVNSGVKAILSEKPLATTVGDAEEMMEAADKAGVRVYINFANRFNLMDIATKYVMQQGLIGRPVYGEIRLDDNISVPTRMWGERSVQWASGSSTAHFLLSHVSDLLRWYLEPAEVEAVYAISQYEVLKYTPDLYDAFLFWNNGIKTRVKAEWIKHIDSLVEFYICLGGEKGGIVHHKSPGYGATRGWRATLDRELSAEQLQQAAAALDSTGVKAKADMISDATRNGEGNRGMLEITESESKNGTDLFIKSILGDAECTPELPTGKDGLEAVKIVNAIVESAEAGELVKIQS
jgi:predicted dehydrogenase